MVKWIILAILLLPLAEILAFILVAAADRDGLGVAPDAGRPRWPGFWCCARPAEAGSPASASRSPTPTSPASRPTPAGFLTVLAGLLLFLPGFLTDLIGAALLIGPVRRWCGKSFRLWVRRQSSDRSAIDLAPGEWEQLPDPKLPNVPGPRPAFIALCRVLVYGGMPC